MYGDMEIEYASYYVYIKDFMRNMTQTFLWIINSIKLASVLEFTKLFNFRNT